MRLIWRNSQRELLSPDEIVIQGKCLFRGFPIVSGYLPPLPGIIL